MRAPARLLTPLTLAGLAGCGGGQTRGSPFEATWADDHGRSMAAFERTFHGTRLPLGADVAVGVVGTRALVGQPLDGGPRWTFPLHVHGRPAIAGSLVIGAGDGRLVALEARTGKLLWSRPTGGRIRGAGDDGRTTVVSLIPTTGSGSLILVINREGNIVRQLEEDAAIGVPAISGDTVFFPWAGRFLSVYDLPSGEERARLDLHARVSHVFAVGGVLFAGERSATRLDEHLGGAEERRATRLDLPAPLGGKLPGDPAWMRPGTDWQAREAEAPDKVRLYARPSTSGPAAAAGGRFAGTFHQVALGFDAASGALAWAHAHDAELLGGAAYQGGFALCDAKGKVTFLDAASGGVTGQLDLGERVDACLVQADGLVRAVTQGGAPQLDAPRLDAQVREVLRLEAPELGGVQKALREGQR
jgi:outer membrane protein assembly factor BamB